MEEVCEAGEKLQARPFKKTGQGHQGVKPETGRRNVRGSCLRHLKEHYWPAIREEQLLSGNYRPQPVRKCEGM